MSVTPITSNTARIGPPAMMPSPALAGAISTLAAPCSPTHVVVDRAVLQLHLDHVAARRVHRLLHRDRHFSRLALAHADAAVAVTDHGERGEAERCGRP